MKQNQLNFKTYSDVINSNQNGHQPFVGRSDVLGEVFRLLSSPVDHILGFYGQPLIGKSSILQELTVFLPQMGAYYPLYFELQDKAHLDLSDIVELLAIRLAEELNLLLPLSRIIHKQKVIVDSFYEQFLPCVLQSLDEKGKLVLLVDANFGYDKLLLQSSSVRSMRSACPSRILLNGFNGHEQPEVGIPFLHFLTDLISQQAQRVKIVFAIQDHYINGHSYSQAPEIRWHHLSFFREEETSQLINLSQQNQNQSLNWSGQAITCMQELTGGHPFLAQRLYQVVWQRAYREQESTLPQLPEIQPLDVEAALLETVEQTTIQLSRWWQGLFFAEQLVLAALAETEKSMSQEDLAKRLLEEDITIEKQLSEVLHVLEVADFIHSANMNYYFKVELLRRWIAQYKPLRYVWEEGKAIRRSQMSLQDTIPTQKINKKSLSGWNPLDHIRLLWWSLVYSQDFSLYKEEQGHQKLYQIGKWSASTLIWLPLLYPSLALATESLPRTIPPSLNDLSLNIGLLMAWLLTGWWGDREDEIPVIVGVIASGIIASSVILGFTGGLISALAGSLALGIAFGMAIRLSLAIAFSVTGRLGSGVALGMVGGLIFGAIVNLFNGDGKEMAIGITIGVGLMVIFILVGSILYGINREGKAAHTSLLGMIGFALLCLSHLFLIWYSFFGGWQLFA